MSDVDQSIDGSRHEVAVSHGLSSASQTASAIGTAEGSPSSPALVNANADVTFEDLKWPLLGMATLIAIMLWLFNDFFSRQLQWAVEHQADWGHTLVIPFIAAYFVYLNRERLLAKPFRTTWIGLVPIIIGVGWYILSTIGPQAIKHHNAHGLGVGITLAGVVLLFCGFRATMVLAFPLAYLFIFGQTISDRFMNIITFRLQDIAARGSHVILVVLGVDTERMGNVLTVYENGEPRQLNIAEACSGMRMLMAFLALGVAMAYTMLKKFWQQAIVVLLAFPTAIFVNMLRVVTLAFLSMVDVNLAAGDFHTFIGLVWLIPAFFIYLGCMWIVTNIVIDEEVDDDDEDDDGGNETVTNPAAVSHHQSSGGS